jgi:hypothetical protein
MRLPGKHDKTQQKPVKKHTQGEHIKREKRTEQIALSLERTVIIITTKHPR